MHAMRGHVLKLSDQYPIRTGTDTDSAAGWWCAGVAGWEEAVHSNATLAGPATRSLHQALRHPSRVLQPASRALQKHALLLPTLFPALRMQPPMFAQA